MFKRLLYIVEHWCVFFIECIIRNKWYERNRVVVLCPELLSFEYVCPHWNPIVTSLWSCTLSYLPHAHRTYTPNKVISLGLQTLIEHIYRITLFPSVYKLSVRNRITPLWKHKRQISTIQKHQRAIPVYVIIRWHQLEKTRNDHDTTWNTCGDLISRVNHRYIAFLDRAKDFYSINPWSSW